MIVKMLEILGRSESSSGLIWLLFVSFYKVNVITAALYEPVTQIRLSIKKIKKGMRLKRPKIEVPIDRR